MVRNNEFQPTQKPGSGCNGCYCDALRTADELMAREVADLRRRERQAAVLRLESLHGGVPESDQGWDLIYSVDLLASLPAVAARQVLKAAIARLRPGGRLLLANVCADVRLGECSDCKKISKVCRVESDMLDLASVVSAKVASGQLMYRDHKGSNIYLEIYKNAAGAEDASPFGRRLRLERVVGTAV